MQPIKLGQATKFGIGIVLLLMMGIGISTKITTNTLVDTTEWVIHTYEVKTKLRALEKNLVDAETGQRGFLLTGKNDYLEPYRASQVERAKNIAELRKLIQDNPKQMQKINVIENLVHQKMNELAKTISLKRQGKEQEVKALVLSGHGKQIMDNLRKKLEEMIKVEDELIVKRQTDAKMAEQLSTLFSLGGTSIATVLGIFTLMFVERKVVRPINQVAAVLASSSTEIAATVEQQERIASQQASSVHQTTTTMDELGASSRTSAEQAEAAAAGAAQVLALVDSHTWAGNSNNHSLKDKVGQIAEQILSLSEQTEHIGTISSLVSELAKQTNMLALNAAVEAVRAGEHGKGFSVVAGEIRKLADQSKGSAERINTLVKEIQKATNSTMIATEEGKKTVDNVVDAINNIATNTQQISLTAKQQAIAIGQVVESMNNLNQGATETASGIAQTKVGTKKLNEAAHNLQAVV